MRISNRHGFLISFNTNQNSLIKRNYYLLFYLPFSMENAMYLNIFQYRSGILF